MSEIKSQPPSWAAISIAWSVVFFVSLLLGRWWINGRREARIAIVAVVLLAVLAVIAMNVYEWVSVTESLVEK